MPATVSPKARKQRGIPLDVCLDVAGVMLVFVRADERVGLMNRHGCEILGYTEEEILDRNWFDSFLPRRAREEARQVFHEILDGKLGDHEHVENVVLAAGGDERLIRWHNAIVEDCGEVLGTLSSGLDITDYEESEAALRESEARFRAILGTTVDAIITADEQGRIESFNAAAEAMFGYRKSQVIGRNLSVLMPPPYSEQHDDYMRSYLTTGKKKVIGVGREVTGRRRNGTTFPLDLSVSEFVVGGRRTFTGVLRDISDRRMLEQEVLRISEEERERIGRDLHDGLGSLLSGTAMGVGALVQRVRRGGEVDADDLEKIAQMIEEGLQQARALSRGLNPVCLESEGLLAALREMTGNVRTVSKVTCTLDVDAPLPPIGPSVATQLYRVAQEAVNNAVKHAKATRIAVELSTSDDQLKLTVRDDGRGMSDVREAGGMGMHIMPYRARLINGRFSVDGANGGTTVTCLVPLERLTASE